MLTVRNHSLPRWAPPFPSATPSPTRGESPRFRAREKSHVYSAGLDRYRLGGRTRADRPPRVHPGGELPPGLLHSGGVHGRRRRYGRGDARRGAPAAPDPAAGTEVHHLRIGGRPARRLGPGPRPLLPP